MSYTTVDQWLLIYPNIAKSSVSSASMIAYLDKGSAYIDSYIAPVVAAVPVSPIPPVLKDLNDDLSYVMFLRRNVHEAGKDAGIEKIWQECVKRLEGIRDGLISLVSSGTDLSLVGGTVSPWSNVSGYSPTFDTVRDIEDAEADPDRVDAEWDERE